MITVRKYLPMFKNQAPDESLIMQALLVFFLNLSVRMRLDRMDGVGEIVWSDDFAVEATVKGFFQGLSREKQSQSDPGSLSVSFKNYFADLNTRDLLDLLTDIVEHYHPRSPDVPVVKNHLEKHAEALNRVVNKS